MSAVLPQPSRRVLVALLGEAPSITEADPSGDSTPVKRALRDLLDALTTHEAALAAHDRIEDAVAAHGHARVPLPADPAGVEHAYAADPTTIDRRLGHGPLARRLKAELRRRQAVVQEAAAAAGLPAARAREAATARALGAAGAHCSSPHAGPCATFGSSSSC